MLCVPNIESGYHVNMLSQIEYFFRQNIVKILTVLLTAFNLVFNENRLLSM